MRGSAGELCLFRLGGYSMLGLYWDNGEENGNYYMIVGYILGYRVWGLKASELLEIANSLLA